MRSSTVVGLVVAVLATGLLVRAGEEPVTAGDLLDFIPAVVADFGAGEQLRGDELRPLLGPQIQAMVANGTAPTAEQVRAWAVNLAEAMINQRLVLREAQRQGVQVDLETGRRLVADQEERLGAKAFSRALRLQGVTAAELARRLAENEAIDRWLETVGPPQDSFTEQAAQAYYDGHLEQFRQPAVYHVSQVLVVVPEDAPEAETAKARARVEGLRREIAAGASFADVARGHSDCPSKADGGDLGPLPAGRMPAAFEQTAMALDAGQISEPVRSPHGWHLIRGGPVSPANQVPFASVRESILASLRDTAREAARQDLIGRLREQAHVSLYITAPGR